MYEHLHAELSCSLFHSVSVSLHMQTPKHAHCMHTFTRRQTHPYADRHTCAQMCVYRCSLTQCYCTWSEFRTGFHVPVWNALPVLFPPFAANIPDSALFTFLTCLCCVGMTEEVLNVFSSFLSILALITLSQHRLSTSVSPLPSRSSFPPCFVSQTA